MVLARWLIPAQMEDSHMAAAPVTYWRIEPDIVGTTPYSRLSQDYRTVIAASGQSSKNSPRKSSIVFFASAEPQQGHMIVALGKIRSRHAIATGRLRVRIDPFYPLHIPIDVRHLVYDSDHHVVNAVLAGIASHPLTPRVFTKRTSFEIFHALALTSPEAREFLIQLDGSSYSIEGSDGMRLREEQDAVSTALDISGLAVPDEMKPVTGDRIGRGQPFGAMLHESYVLDTEDDLIADDLRRFDKKAVFTPACGAATVISGDNLRLTVINVNRKELENVHGVDLVYYDHINDQAIAIQYKRLERKVESVDGVMSVDWIYCGRSSIKNQLKRMWQPRRANPTSTADWRMTPSPTFFKFVRAEDYNSDSKQLLPGMYVPSDYLRLGLQDRTFNSGPRGGFRISYNNTRYLTSSMFTELARRGWIGSCKTDKSSLADDVARCARSHQVVLALRNANA